MSEADLKAQLNAVYAERDKCVSLIARMALALGFTAGIGQHVGDEWEDDWRNIVFIDLPSGQVSWHIHNSELPWFAFLPRYDAPWDGHTTEEKYQRVLEPDIERYMMQALQSIRLCFGKEARQEGLNDLAHQIGAVVRIGP